MKSINSIFEKKPLCLAPMEDVTDVSYRLICKELGADVVYTEFVNSDGLVRDCSRAKKKIEILKEERPIGIQVYGHDINSMVDATKIINESSPDIIDINAGCWVKKVSGRGAGAGLLKDPVYFEKMVRSVVEVSDFPVTVKTRLGWDEQSINILEIAKRIEDAGAKVLTIHCRTRSQGMVGVADWTWVDRIKKEIDIPVVFNGGVMEPIDVINIFNKTKSDGIMVARGAIGVPWFFSEAKDLLKYGEVKTIFDLNKKVEICLKHFDKHLDLKGDKRGLTSFRKYYGGYFKGFDGASSLRRTLVTTDSVDGVKDVLFGFLAENDKKIN